MIYCLRTNSDNPDFRKLVMALDADLRNRDGEEHDFYAQFNKTDKIKEVIVAYDDETPVGCGAIKADAPTGTMEVKRMFVTPGCRGKGVASVILKNLEAWAVELNASKCVLETGKRQPEAIRLYTKNAYHLIPNYGQYEKVENSVCFEKILSN